MSDLGVIAIRWTLYVDLGLTFGLPLFTLYALDGGRTRLRPIAALTVGMALLGLLASVLGFVIQGAAMAGIPLSQPDFSILSDLLDATALGLALKVRLAALLAILLCAAISHPVPRTAATISALAGACALATLAWGGHGAAGEGSAGWLQLGADIVHLLAAGAWLGAIVAFILLAACKDTAGDIERVSLAERALRGFAAVGTLIVGLLTLTGAVNGLFLVGAEHVTSLAASIYGLLLIAKLLLFAAMLGLAALNRYRLTPALARAVAQRDASHAMGLLRRSLCVEGSLAILILALVAWLGTLSPPMSG